jgi:hypothetical protein
MRRVRTRLREIRHAPKARKTEEGREEGRVEGREEGLEVGLEKGTRQGIVVAVRPTLEVRFGGAPQPLPGSIARCENVEQWRALHRQAMTVGSLDELQL